ncbi:MAG: S8 family serine peptidase [Lentisphaerae bacterium]|nr:S8 family serine peptidase [Lentisphaerota bacterium]MBT4821548.1 S8 family serine peptidase [Lentisphaerota bacterium]MBT5610301.1 S8 family serine peptidase [Lentisphaerota bacterium]MBT7056408.1 S8 family serine peptidase [Lentisphaerota bacterium]MBT7848220.1 S8 family serine peptidase [Lentisphaerota bacterium]
MFRWRHVLGLCIVVVLLGVLVRMGETGALRKQNAMRGGPDQPPVEMDGSSLRESTLDLAPVGSPAADRGGTGSLANRQEPRGSAGGDHRDPDVVPDEYLLFFDGEEGFERFLADAKMLRIEVIGTLPRWRALNLRTASIAGLERLLGERYGTFSFEQNSFVRAPDRTGVPGRGVPFAASALDWLGVAGKNSTWGEGITIAVLDTLVQDHPSLKGVAIRRFSVLGEHVVEHGDYAGHGTAVASLLAGSGGAVAGIAPAANVLAVRVMTDDGVGDAFTLADGIILAVDQGADVLNLSLGMQSDSRIVREAIEYALENGVAVVAAAGNDGSGSVQFPARYDGVTAVSAVDAMGTHADYANTGEAIDIAAPGVGINAGWSDGETVSLGGTSVSTPFVAGALASILSEESSASADEATALLLGHADDSGAPGADPVFGEGVLNVNRVLQRNEEGIVDAALSGFYIAPEPVESGARLMWVSAENRGTEPIASLLVRVQVGDGLSQDQKFRDVAVGDVVSVPVEIRLDEVEEAGILIRSAAAPVGVTDTNPANDGMRTRIRLVTVEEDVP